MIAHALAMLARWLHRHTGTHTPHTATLTPLRARQLDAEVDRHGVTDPRPRR